MRTRSLALPFALPLALVGLSCLPSCKQGAEPVAQAAAERKLEAPPAAPQLELMPLAGSAQELAVVAARPHGKLLGLSRITFTFNKPMVALGPLEGADPAAALTLAPPQKGRWRWLGSSSVEFVPEVPLPYSTSFTATVAAGLKALDGSKLAKAYALTFTTPTIEVRESDPGDARCRFSAPDQHFKVIVNQPLAQPEKALSFLLEGAGSADRERVPATVISSVNQEDDRRAHEPPRRIARATADEVGFKDQRTRYEIAPARKLPLGAKFSLALAADATAQQGPLPPEQTWEVKCSVMGPMRIVEVVKCFGRTGSGSGTEEHCATGPVQLTASNPIASMSELRKLLRFDPPVALDWDESRDDLGVERPLFGSVAMLTGRFQPGQKYQVHLDAGLKDTLGQAAPAFDGEVAMDDLLPSLYLGRERALLEAAGDGQLPVQVTNLAELDADLWSLTPAQLAQLQLCSGPACKPVPATPPDQQLRLKLTYPRNEPHLHGVDLRAALGKKQLGIVVGKLWAPGTDFADHPLRVLAQITDVAVHARLGATSGLAWVTSVAKGTPIAGATVRVFDASGQQRAEVKTDESGAALLPGFDQLMERRSGYEGPRVLVAATSGDDTGLVPVDGLDDPSEVGRDYDVLSDHGLGLVFADRGIYRPGDVAHLHGLLRKLVRGELHALPEGTQVLVKLTDPDDKSVLEQKLALSKQGSFSVDAPLPKDGRLGSFSISVSDEHKLTYGFGTLLLAEYRAPQFRVDVLSDPQNLTAGAALKATVVARYLFGGAMSGAQATWSAFRSTAEFTPPRNEGFRFGRATWSWDDGTPAPDSGFFASGVGEISAQGTLAVSAGTAEALADRPTQYTLEAEVADVSRQRVAGRASVLVHPAAFYLGLGKTDVFAKVGEEVRLPIVAAKPGGDRAVGVAVHVSVLQRSWHSVKKKGFNGIFQAVSEPVDEKVAECDVKTAADPRDCKLTLQKPGFFTLRAEAKDDAGHLALSTASLYAVGAGAVAWQDNDSPRVDLVPDKSEYSVGEVAHVLVKSPFAECAALVTTEREGVSEHRVLKLAGNAVSVDVPITEAMVPNVFVGVLLQRGRVPNGSPIGSEVGDDPGRPAMRSGYAELKVGTAIKRLSVALKTSRSEYRPREKVPVDLQVLDSANKGVQAEVLVYAVDEAVLRLTGYQVPDPIESMFPHHSLSVALGEPLMQLVRRQRFGEKGEVQPGGGGGAEASADSVRNKFLTTIEWRTVLTDSSGKARVELTLPDNLTTFRILAVAATEGDRFGSGQSSIQVSLPLLVLPALPRFARVGDEFEAGVILHAHGGAKQVEVTVSAEVSGGLKLEGSAERKITVEDGVAKEVRFKLRGVSAGPAKLRFRAQASSKEAGPLEDGVEEIIPVQLPLAMEAVAVAGDTDGKKDEALARLDEVAKGVGGLELQLSSTALGSLDEGMKQLIDYPYGCLEQLSSRLVPFVALREVQKIFGADAGANEKNAAQAEAMNGMLRELTARDDGRQATDPDEVVRTTIAKITALQTPSGGFLFWPTAVCPYAWPSIYATLALYRAGEQGYAVRKEVLEGAKKFLGSKAAGNASCPNEVISRETRAFALQVLARMGAPKPSYYDELFAEKDEMALFGKALLADAMILGKGKKPRAMLLLQDVLDEAKETPREVHFEEEDAASYAPLFSSDTRTTGMVLQTLVDLQPQHPYVGKIARYLTGVRKGGQYRNTQEAAYALMGLTELVRVRERTAPDFTATAKLGAKEIAREEFHGRSLSVKTRKIPMAELQGGSKQLPLSFEAAGTGTLYYTALLRYAPAELPKTARNEGLFVQRWFEPYDQAGKQTLELQAGELVRVRVRVASPQERSFVAVDIPLPAGLEAVDTQLATTRVQPRGLHEEAQEGEESASYDDQDAGSFWSPFDYSEKRDDRVVYFADHLPAGVHVVSFVARATTPGKFVLKPAHAGEMYAPEVFGRSEGGTVTVVAASPLAQR